MSEKKKHKPGVRTNLNSGDKKVQLKDSKTASQQAAPNPTAAAASKKLPSMALSKEANWAEETTSFVLSAIAPASEKVQPQGKTAPDTEVVFVAPELPDVIDIEATVTAKEKDKNTFKNKYNKKKDSNGNIINNMKDYIAKGISDHKIDYEQLQKIQTGLHVSISDVKETINGKMSELMDSKNAIAAAAKEKAKKSKSDDYEIPKNLQIPEEPKKKKGKLPKSEVPKTEKKQTEQTKVTVEKPEATETTIAQKQENRDFSQKLNQAIQRRDGAEKALSALNAQLEYAPKEQQKSIKDRIAKKQEQLEEAQKQIDALNAEKEAQE